MVCTCQALLFYQICFSILLSLFLFLSFLLLLSLMLYFRHLIFLTYSLHIVSLFLSFFSSSLLLITLFFMFTMTSPLIPLILYIEIFKLVTYAQNVIGDNSLSFFFSLLFIAMPIFLQRLGAKSSRQLT